MDIIIKNNIRFKTLLKQITKEVNVKINYYENTIINLGDQVS